MADKISQYETDITQDKPGARDAFDTFKRTRAAYLTKAIKVHAQSCDVWASQIFEAAEQEITDRQLKIMGR
ncbi:hypothetical protein H0H81_008688 [Sphagnurus paluster]|uniref:Uncharacterized protein n=1 Tax=Sphagnurus paluster TaxID=117069 RepID=A0A9P7FV63_9AGAR|nr:hypothetical protein H0H81_008688 [Sphagnurus paluster]